MALLAGVLGLGRLIRPARPQAEKYITVRERRRPGRRGWAQSQIRYYIFALLFVMFDVEAVFIFPWAIRLEALRTSSASSR